MNKYQIKKHRLLRVSADQQVTISAHSGAVETVRSFDNQFGELITTVTLPKMLCSLRDSHQNSLPGSHVNHCDYEPSIVNSAFAGSNIEPRPARCTSSATQPVPSCLLIASGLRMPIGRQFFLVTRICSQNLSNHRLLLCSLLEVKPQPETRPNNY